MQHLSCYSQNTDSRGGFFGITRDPWCEVNFIETVAGAVRGGHYHKETREMFFIIAGEIDIELLHIHTDIKNSFTAKKGDMFIIDPFELHTFKCRTASQWINMLSKPLDAVNPDFHRVENR